MRMATREEVLHSVVADPEAGDEPLSAAIEVRRTLRRILRIELDGLESAFPVQPGLDALDLDVIDPDVDLVTLAQEAHDLLGLDPAQARERLFPLLVALERKAHAVFRSTRLDVHPHLAPFVMPLRRLHRDVLRHIILTGVFVNEPGDVERAGSRLGWHGPEAFNAATAMAFVQEAVSRGAAVLSDRYRMLADVMGGEEQVPEPVDAWMGRVRRERGLNVVVRPGDLRTPELCRTQEAPWFALGVHRADAELGGGDGLPDYVRRPEHDTVAATCRKALEQERFALVAVGGPSACGKTRLLYEVLREVGRDLWVIAPVPHRAREVHRPAVHPRLVGGRPAVLWLDDLELFVADNATALSATDLARLNAPDGPPMLVLCTHGGHFRDLCARDPVRAAELERMLALATLRLRLDPRLGEAETVDACARFPQRAADIRAVGLGPALISASRLVHRYDDDFVLPADVGLDSKEGLAFVDAILAWRDLVGVEVVSPSWAEVAWGRLLPLRGCRSPPRAEGCRFAQDWAAAEVAPGASLAWWDDDAEGWRASPAVEIPEQRRAEVQRQLDPVLHRWRGSDASRGHGREP